MKLPQDKIDDILQRSMNEGLEILMCSSLTDKDYKKLNEATDFYNNKYGRTVIIPSFGIQPMFMDQVTENWEEKLKEAVFEAKNKPNYPFLLGEGGLVHGASLEKKVKEHQPEVFRKQMNLAGDLNIPITLHGDYNDELMLSIVKETVSKYPNMKDKIILHAFNGTADLVKEYERAGCYFSIGPTSIYEKHFDMIKNLPLNRILFETDTPVPQLFNKELLAKYPDVDVSKNDEGKEINEPRFVNLLIQETAKIRGKETDEEIAEAAYQNSKELIKKCISVFMQIDC